jgi:hypothetical protein
MLASVALVLIAYHSVAFGGKTFDASSTVPGVNGVLPPTGVAPDKLVDGIRVDRGSGAWVITPWAQVTHREYAHARWPLWNPFEGVGEPLAGNLQSGVFDPLLLAVDLHPTTRVWDLTYLFVFALGAVATYGFLRVLGIGILGSVTGAGAFTMCGFFAMDAGNGFVRVYAYLPLLFLTVELVARSSRLRWVAGMGAAVAGSIVAGMPESTFFVIAAAGGYAAYCAIRRPAGDRLPVLFRLACATVFGLALASPLLLLFVQYLPLSFNTHGVAVGSRTGATGALLYWLVPFANGYPTMPRVPGFQYDRGWCGAAAATLGAVAAAAPKAMRRFGGWFFLVLSVVLLAKNHNVRYFQWIGNLPGFNRSDSIAFAPPLIGFGVAVLAAIGIHALATGDVRWRRLVVAATGLGIVVALLLTPNRPVLAAAHGSLARRSAVLAITGASVAFLAGLGASVVRNCRRIRLAAAALAALAVVAELYLLFPQAIFAPRSDPFRPPPWLALIPAASQGQPAPRVFGYDDVLYPDTAGVFGLQDIRTLNGLYVSRYATFLKHFIFPFVDRFDGNGVPSSQIEGNPMFDLLGVRFVLTTTKLLDRDMTPTQTAQYALAGTAGGVRVFENVARVPRAVVAEDVHEVGRMSDAVSYLASLGHPTADGTTHVDLFDPAHQAVVEISAEQQASLPPLPLVQSESRPARIVSYDSQRVEVHVSAGLPGLLVLTDSYFPGWRATVNGRPAPVLPADVAFRGVLLGSGDSQVVFSYHSPGGNLGWAIPLLALASFGAVAFVLHSAARPRHPLEGPDGSTASASHRYRLPVGRRGDSTR